MYIKLKKYEKRLSRFIGATALLIAVLWLMIL